MMFRCCLMLLLARKTLLLHLYLLCIEGNHCYDHCTLAPSRNYLINSCNVSDISVSPDDKLNFFLEASRRSNMVSLQLYVKEVESPPGTSAASSIFSRNFNIEGVVSWRSSETKVFFHTNSWTCLLFPMMMVNYKLTCFVLFSGSYLDFMCMERFDG